MNVLEIYCPNCQAACPASNVNITSLVAKCDHCDSVFRLPIESISETEAALLPPSRPDAIEKVDEYDSSLHLKKKWRTWLVIPLIFFCIAWDSFLVFWYAIAFSQMNPQSAEFWLMTLFPIGHVAVGVALTYLVVASLLNTTSIRIQQGSLSVRHRPVPWREPTTLETSEIRGFELEHSAWRARMHPATFEQNCSLAAHMRNGSQKILLRGLPAAQARYIAYELAGSLQLPIQDNLPTTKSVMGILDAFRQQVPASFRKHMER